MMIHKQEVVELINWESVSEVFATSAQAVAEMARGLQSGLGYTHKNETIRTASTEVTQQAVKSLHGI